MFATETLSQIVVPRRIPSKPHLSVVPQFKKKIKLKAQEKNGLGLHCQREGPTTLLISFSSSHLSISPLKKISRCRMVKLQNRENRDGV